MELKANRGRAALRWMRKDLSVEDLLWGLWNGITAWVILIAHVLGAWDRFPVYNVERDGGWYQFGFLLGAGSPFLGAIGARRRRGRRD